MTNKIYKLMNWAGIEEITYSESDNPHEILGPRKTGTQILVQAFFPGASKVSVVLEKAERTISMELVDESGYFAALIPEKGLMGYHYLVKDSEGKETVHGDPYRFEVQITQKDIDRFSNGIHYTVYEKLGAHPMELGGVKGVYFAVWAPNVMRASVVGDFNKWDGRVNQMRRIGDSGIFELFLPDAKAGDNYKFEFKLKSGLIYLKADPYENASQLRPDTASVIVDISDFKWEDEEFIKNRERFQTGNAPISVYEMYLGSFVRAKVGKEYANYREIAPKVIEYIKEMGYTHVELMPVMEHFLDSSWGYQTIGYYAPTARYGSSEDFMYFVNELHKAEIGVILDWTPAYFPKDSHGLSGFDGTCLYEHLDPRQGLHPYLGTLLYNYGRPQVSNYLIANALFWVEKFHVDGIRMDAVGSMLYLDYGKGDGEWIANMYGGNENLEAIEMIKHINSILKKRNPGVLTIAEGSTVFPNTTGELEDGGLGFDFKWNAGFINDYLDYIKYDPYFRSHHHSELTFSMIYAYSERFMLALSHDEVVRGKGAAIGKMPGDAEQKFANLRLSYSYIMTHPGRKLLFMGQDLGEFDEWNENRTVQWELRKVEEHEGIAKLIGDLNRLYRTRPELSVLDDVPEGFEWINHVSAGDCFLTYVRKGKEPEDILLIVANFAGISQEITTGVPYEGKYKEIFNSDDAVYGGSNVINSRARKTRPKECDNRHQSITLKLAPLSLSIMEFIPFTEEELEKEIERRIRENTPIRKTKKIQKTPTVKKEAGKKRTAGK